MVTKLKVNLNKIKDKFILIKANRIVSLVSAVALSLCLASCKSLNNNSNNEEITSNNSITQSDPGLYNPDSNTKYPIEFNYTNYDENTLKNESIYITDKSGAIYSSIDLEKDGYMDYNVSTKEGKIGSLVLGNTFEYPETDENHKIVVNIDYNTKSIDIKLEELEKTNIR